MHSPINLLLYHHGACLIQRWPVLESVKVVLQKLCVCERPMAKDNPPQTSNHDSRQTYAITQGILLQIRLVLFVGRVKGVGAHNVRVHRPRGVLDFPRVDQLLNFGLDFFGNFLLFVVFAENHRCVLRAHIIALAVSRCRVVWR